MEKFTQAITNLHNLLTGTMIASIASVLLVVCFLYIAFGNTEKGKVYLWSAIFGICGVYSASFIANAIWN